MAISDADIEHVRAIVAAIPPGSVATYGDLAAAAGLASPRIAGAIMRMDTADLPWWRVIAASGKPAPHLRRRQLETLAAEGVPTNDRRVLMDRCDRPIAAGR